MYRLPVSLAITSSPGVSAAALPEGEMSPQMRNAATSRVPSSRPPNEPRLVRRIGLSMHQRRGQPAHYVGVGLYLVTPGIHGRSSSPGPGGLLISLRLALARSGSSAGR